MQLAFLFDLFDMRGEARLYLDEATIATIIVAQVSVSKWSGVGPMLILLFAPRLSDLCVDDGCRGKQSAAGGI